MDTSIDYYYSNIESKVICETRVKSYSELENYYKNLKNGGYKGRMLKYFGKGLKHLLLLGFYIYLGVEYNFWLYPFIVLSVLVFVMEMCKTARFRTYKDYDTVFKDWRSLLIGISNEDSDILRQNLEVITGEDNFITMKITKDHTNISNSQIKALKWGLRGDNWRIWLYPIKSAIGLYELTLKFLIVYKGNIGLVKTWTSFSRYHLRNLNEVDLELDDRLKAVEPAITVIQRRKNSLINAIYNLIHNCSTVLLFLSFIHPYFTPIAVSMLVSTYTSPSEEEYFDVSKKCEIIKKEFPRFDVNLINSYYSYEVVNLLESYLKGIILPFWYKLYGENYIKQESQNTEDLYNSFLNY